MDARTSRSPFYLRKQRRELREKIYHEAEKLGPLRGTALAVVDYVYSFVSPDEDINAPYFEKKTDWVLKPDNWIALTFGGRGGYAIHVSVGMPTLSARTELNLRPGRFPDWTKFTITSPQQLPSAMLYLEEAYYGADSRHRRLHGKPKRKPAGVSPP